MAKRKLSVHEKAFPKHQGPLMKSGFFENIFHLKIGAGLAKNRWPTFSQFARGFRDYWIK